MYKYFYVYLISYVYIHAEIHNTRIYSCNRNQCVILYSNSKDTVRPYRLCMSYRL